MNNNENKQVNENPSEKENLSAIERFSATKQEPRRKSRVKKAKKSLLKAQKRAIIILVAAVVLLSVLCALVMVLVKRDVDTYTESFYKKDDNGNVTETIVYKYYSRKQNNSFKVINENGDDINSFTEDGTLYYETELGTMLTLGDDGKISVYAVVDLEGIEVKGSGNRILIFPHTERENIKSITAVNANGGFKISAVDADTNDDGKNEHNFYIDGYESAPINRVILAALVTKCGYTLSVDKLQTSVMKSEDEKHKNDEGYTKLLDDNGNINFAAYGLTESADSQYFILTNTADVSYKIFIGNKIPSGAGYYVRYSDASGDRNAVYILSADSSASSGYSSSMETTVLAAAKDIVSPYIVMPLSLNTYFNVTNFTVQKYDEALAKDDDDKNDYKTVIAFNFEDLSIRNHTIRQQFPYKIVNSEKLGLTGYEIDPDKVNDFLQSIYTITTVSNNEQTTPTAARYVKVYGLTSKKLGSYTELTKDEIKNDDSVRESIEMLQKCGLINPKYIIGYDSPFSGTALTTQVIYISEKTADKTYFVWSPLFQQIVEINEQYLNFIEWDTFDWVNRRLLDLSISYVDSFKVTAPDYNVLFNLEQTHRVDNKVMYSSTSSNYYSNSVTVGTDGKRTFTLTLGMPYTIPYADGTTKNDTYKSTLASYSLYVIENYCKYLLKGESALVGITTDELAKMNEFASKLSVKNVSDGVVTVAVQLTDAGNNFLSATNYNLIFTYSDDNFIMSVQHTGKIAAREIYNRNLFDNFYGTYVVEANLNLTQSERKAVDEFLLTTTEATADIVRATASVNGGEPQEVDIEQFRMFYQTMLYATYGKTRVDQPIGDNGSDVILTDADRAAYIALGDKCDLLLDVKTSAGNDFTIRMYNYSAMRCFVTNNGDGKFWLMCARADKIVADAKKVISGEEIVPDNNYN